MGAPYCSICKKKGHETRNCKKRKICDYCGQEGHQNGIGLGCPVALADGKRKKAEREAEKAAAKAAQDVAPPSGRAQAMSMETKGIEGSMWSHKTPSHERIQFNQAQPSQPQNSDLRVSSFLNAQSPRHSQTRSNEESSLVAPAGKTLESTSSVDPCGAEHKSSAASSTSAPGPTSLDWADDVERAASAQQSEAVSVDTESSKRSAGAQSPQAITVTSELNTVQLSTAGSSIEEAEQADIESQISGNVQEAAAVAEMEDLSDQTPAEEHVTHSQAIAEDVLPSLEITYPASQQPSVSPPRSRRSSIAEAVAVTDAIPPSVDSQARASDFGDDPLTPTSTNAAQPPEGDETVDGLTGALSPDPKHQDPLSKTSEGEVSSPSLVDTGSDSQDMPSRKSDKYTIAPLEPDAARKHRDRQTVHAQASWVRLWLSRLTKFLVVSLIIAVCAAAFTALMNGLDNIQAGQSRHSDENAEIISAVSKVDLLVSKHSKSIARLDAYLPIPYSSNRTTQDLLESLIGDTCYTVSFVPPVKVLYTTLSKAYFDANRIFRFSLDRIRDEDTRLDSKEYLSEGFDRFRKHQADIVSFKIAFERWQADTKSSVTSLLVDLKTTDRHRSSRSYFGQARDAICDYNYLRWCNRPAGLERPQNIERFLSSLLSRTRSLHAETEKFRCALEHTARPIRRALEIYALNNPQISGMPSRDPSESIIHRAIISDRLAIGHDSTRQAEFRSSTVIDVFLAFHYEGVKLTESISTRIEQIVRHAEVALDNLSHDEDGIQLATAWNTADFAHNITRTVEALEWNACTSTDTRIVMDLFEDYWELWNVRPHGLPAIEASDGSLGVWRL